MAARIGNPFAFRDGLPLGGAELRKAIGPVVARAVGGRSVDHPDLRIVDQGDSLPGPVVGKAQKDDVRGIEKLPPLLVVVPLVLVDPQKLQILSGTDPVKYLQTGRPALAVDVDLCFSHCFLSLSILISLCLYVMAAVYAVHSYHNTIALFR